MNILAVESSGMVAAVAVVREGRLIGEYFLDHEKTHSQHLMPLVEQLLYGLDIKISDIDIFAASKGPGSFTGLRIGLATVKGLAQAIDKPVIGVPTLDGLAYNLLSRQGLICPIMNARREQVYTSIYRSNGKLQRLDEFMAIPVIELVQKLNTFDEPVMFNGDGVPAYWDLIKNEMGDKGIMAPVNLLTQRASSIACLALDKYKAEGAQKYTEVVPFYLRKSQAEQKFSKKG
ncbi:MAG: tRNA (adenosine(37)-N6)-threonylcarbamoyltransferase complex dimerization subunit type 1 TsaB [Clostridiales bacterium]|nr:tRNA (adenosine(37)-N6)-threonylcarbamoyltransferase complex dimerization subunit type 1 TsaB [Clostridiales bacterium]